MQRGDRNSAPSTEGRREAGGKRKEQDNQSEQAGGVCGLVAKGRGHGWIVGTAERTGCARQDPLCMPNTARSSDDGLGARVKRDGAKEESSATHKAMSGGEEAMESLGGRGGRNRALKVGREGKCLWEATRVDSPTVSEGRACCAQQQGAVWDGLGRKTSAKPGQSEALNGTRCGHQALVRAATPVERWTRKEKKCVAFARRGEVERANEN
ncbi:hypothetical protein ERJ75_001273100 [Trypanosoma vivax]|nr:hypothetical protein ERJ75_001273100 [Trypanosoma vivax]